MIPKKLQKLGIGVAGLGRAFSVMVPTFSRDPRVAIVAGADPREAARKQFQQDFQGKSYSTVEELCADPAVDVVYIATPHQLHAENACTAATHKKHMVVEKPMALTLEHCSAMIAAARKAGVHLIVGHSHSFDAPILQARKIIASGALGRVRMISALNYTDFLYRPRRPEELDTASGGGAVYNQAAHQVDIVRMLAGSRVKSVRAFTGAWDRARPTEGAYSCQLNFEDGTFATLVYSGYAHFDSDEFTGWIGELGVKKKPANYGAARRLLAGNEAEIKNAGIYGGPAFRKPPEATAHQHFGLVLVSCERGDVRPLPSGVVIYGDDEERVEPLPPPKVPRGEVVDELYEAVVNGRAPLHNGEWAMATMEVCFAMLRSSREQREISL
jgi:phthalate 4,5-cis-dihydrodiol dehydrogenase